MLEFKRIKQPPKENYDFSNLKASFKLYQSKDAKIVVCEDPFLFLWVESPPICNLRYIKGKSPVFNSPINIIEKIEISEME